MSIFIKITKIKLNDYIIVIRTGGKGVFFIPLATSIAPLKGEKVEFDKFFECNILYKAPPTPEEKNTVV